MEKRSIRTLKLIAGWLCLDFSNTLGMHARKMRPEFLNSYFDLKEWSHYAGIITEEEERALLHKAKKSPEQAESVLQKALELREIIFRIFSSIATNAAPSEKDILSFNKKLSRMLKKSKLDMTESGIVIVTYDDDPREYYAEVANHLAEYFNWKKRGDFQKVRVIAASNLGPWMPGKKDRIFR